MENKVAQFLKLVEQGIYNITEDGDIYRLYKLDSHGNGNYIKLDNPIKMKYEYTINVVLNNKKVKLPVAEIIYCHFNNIIELPSGYEIRRLDKNKGFEISNLIATSWDDVEYKQCPSCENIKHRSEYHNNQSNYGRISNICKFCEKEYRNEEDEKLRISLYHKEHYKKNSEKIKNRQRKYRLEKPEIIKDRKKKYAENNKEKISKYHKEWNKQNRERLNYKSKMRYRNNLSARIAKNLRSRIGELIHKESKSKHTLEILGMDVDEFLVYLERRFSDGMTWENYGKVWHIDHIIPCAYFDLTKKEDVNKCFHYTNMQPMFANENISKGSLVDGIRYRHFK